MSKAGRPLRSGSRFPRAEPTLGVDRAAVTFGWDNEFPACTAEVPAFSIERHNVTNGQFLEFVDAGGYRDSRWWSAEDWRWVESEHVEHPLFWDRSDRGWLWRGMFDSVPLPLSWPVYVSHAEAAAYARWRGRACRPKPSTSAPHSAKPAATAPAPRIAFIPGVKAHRQPSAACSTSSAGIPQPAGSHPAGASAWGVEDLVGNGWEWTSTPFAPFPGFRAMASYPEYSADFFDGEHFVMKGASPATARELLRPSFRNWFRGRYPYVYATFRCVK